jgi:hypothetical protein
VKKTGVLILENTPAGVKKYQPTAFGGKIRKGEEKKVANVKEKGIKGKERKKGGTKERKWEVKGYNKCKIGKD